MQFENVVQEETFGRLKEYLFELFDDPFFDAETAHFYVRYGSTVLEISVDPYGPEEANVEVIAYCVQGVDPREELLVGLLELNHELPIGAFSLVGKDIFVSHSIFGRSVSRSSLITAISAVATVSDDYDDRIVQKYGGQTALDRIRDTGGRKKRVAVK